MGEKKKSAASGMGGITVFMVLAVLTIAVFSVLTLTSAMADTNLSKKNSALVTAYYEADALGVDLLAALEAAWPRGTAAPAEADFLAAAQSAVPGSELTVWPVEEDVLFACTLNVAQWRHLEIEAVLSGEGPQRWQITRWVFLPEAYGEVDEGLPVLQIED